MGKEKAAEFFEVLDCVTTLRSANAPFGEVTAARITVRGYVRRAKLAYDKWAKYDKDILCDEKNESKVLWNASLDALGDNKVQTVWCLWVTVELGKHVNGLLLVPVEEGEERSFRRIGIFRSREGNRGRQMDDDGRNWFLQSGERRVIVIV